MEQIFHYKFKSHGKVYLLQWNNIHTAATIVLVTVERLRLAQAVSLSEPLACVADQWKLFVNFFANLHLPARTLCLLRSNMQQINR